MTKTFEAMKNHYSPTIQHPMVVKYVKPSHIGVQSHNLMRHAIGYVVQGRKHIHSGDYYEEVKCGDIFFLSIGNHYAEDLPEADKPFEQIVIYYSSEQLRRILSHLSMTYGLKIVNDHSCANCCDKNHVVYPAWSIVHNFFLTLDQYIRDGVFHENGTAETIKMTELIYLILMKKDCCLSSKLLENMDSDKESFEQIIYNNVFNDISIDALAELCNRSLTSFKKEFKRCFKEPPHKWLVKQRLRQSRLLLISTNKSISEIGNECMFPNISHFIKLFKKEYSVTPAVYRSQQIGSKLKSEKEQQLSGKVEA